MHVICSYMGRSREEISLPLECSFSFFNNNDNLYVSLCWAQPFAQTSTLPLVEPYNISSVQT